MFSEVKNEVWGYIVIKNLVIICGLFLKLCFFFLKGVINMFEFMIIILVMKFFV